MAPSGEDVVGFRDTARIANAASRWHFNGPVSRGVEYEVRAESWIGCAQRERPRYQRTKHHAKGHAKQFPDDGRLGDCCDPLSGYALWHANVEFQTQRFCQLIMEKLT